MMFGTHHGAGTADGGAGGAATNGLRIPAWLKMPFSINAGAAVGTTAKLPGRMKGEHGGASIGAQPGHRPMVHGVLLKMVTVPHGGFHNICAVAVVPAQIVTMAATANAAAIEQRMRESIRGSSERVELNLIADAATGAAVTSVVMCTVAHAPPNAGKRRHTPISGHEDGTGSTIHGNNTPRKRSRVREYRDTIRARRVPARDHPTHARASGTSASNGLEMNYRM